MADQTIGIASRTHAISAYAALNSLRREPDTHSIYMTFMLADRGEVLPHISGVPDTNISAGYIVLNVSMTAAPLVELSKTTCLSVRVRFSGVASEVVIPLNYLIHTVVYDANGEEIHKIIYEPFRESPPPVRPTVKRPELTLVK